MFAERKCFLRKASSSERKQQGEKNMSSKNSNQINVPQAREAMDRFKMQAAQEEDVFSTS